MRKKKRKLRKKLLIFGVAVNVLFKLIDYCLSVMFEYHIVQHLYCTIIVV